MLLVIVFQCNIQNKVLEVCSKYANVPGLIDKTKTVYTE